MTSCGEAQKRAIPLSEWRRMFSEKAFPSYVNRNNYLYTLITVLRCFSFIAMFFVVFSFLFLRTRGGLFRRKRVEEGSLVCILYRNSSVYVLPKQATLGYYYSFNVPPIIKYRPYSSVYSQTGQNERYQQPSTRKFHLNIYNPMIIVPFYTYTFRVMSEEFSIYRNFWDRNFYALILFIGFGWNSSRFDFVGVLFIFCTFLSFDGISHSHV